MITGLRVNMKQLLFFLFVLLILLITAVIVLHAATPHLFHSMAFTPKFLNRR